MWLKIFGAVAVLVGIILIFEGENILKMFFDKNDEDKYARVGIKALGVMFALLRRIDDCNSIIKVRCGIYLLKSRMGRRPWLGGLFKRYIPPRTQIKNNKETD